MRKLRVFLAEDHAVVREGFKKLIEAEKDMTVVGEASSGTQVLERVPGLRPDVVVMDISMPELDGIQASRRLKEIAPKLTILALTVHEDRGYVRELLDAGVRGYVLKRAAADELIRAIRTVADGELYLDPRMAGKMIGIATDDRPADAPPVAPLSPRESRVLQLLAEGYTNKEIAAQLGVSVKTVETYKTRSMDKLGLRSRVEIVRYATKAGWLGDRR